MSSYDQLKIIELIKDHDVTAFKTFYDLWDERVYFFFLKKTSDSISAEELSHLTFIKFWQYRHTLNLDFTAEAQLFHRARMVFIDWLRKEALLQKQKEAAKLFYEQKEADGALNEIDPDLQNALLKLPPMRRKVIELSHLKGYKYKEIAKELQISIKTVDNHIYQALKQLRKILSLLLF